MKTPMLASTENALALGKMVVRAVVRKLDEFATRQRLRRDYDFLSRLDNKRLAELGLTDAEIRGIRQKLYADYAALSWG
jgi:hypothetical protein